MEKVKITHFVNPHLFWFKMETANQKELIDLEYKIAEIALCEHNLQRVYKVGDCIAVNCLKWQKYVRGVVLELNLRKTTYLYTVWLVDHGFPVESMSMHMFPLHEKFRTVASNVHRGGIADVIPVKRKDAGTKQDSKCTETWQDRVCRQLSHLLEQMENHIFMQIMYSQQTNKHVWCDLKLNTNYGAQCFVSDWLIRYNLAERIDRVAFKSIGSNLFTLRDFDLNNVKNERIHSNVILNEAVQASQAKVHQWLKHNFMQTENSGFFDDEDTQSLQSVDGMTQEMLQTACKLFSSSKLPPKPDESAFDMSYDNMTNSDIMSEQSMKVQPKEMTKSKTVDCLVQTDIVADKERLMQNVAKATKPIATVKPYFSPFEDNYVRPNREYRTNEVVSKYRMVPAGFDVTQLVEYQNPNHWHRRKSTRDADMPHDECVLFDETMSREREETSLQSKDEQLKPSTTSVCIKQIRASERMLNIPPPNDESNRTALIAKAKASISNWSELPCQLTRVKMGNNRDWRQFFVQLSGPDDVRQFEALQNLLKEQAEHLIPATEISMFELGRDYVVKNEDRYFRAQLQRIMDEKCLRFFLVDLAFFHEVTVSDESQNIIFESTLEIIKYMQFQAVHCTLAGLNLKPNLSINVTVGPKQPLFVYGCVLEPHKFVVNLNINSYKIVLYVCNEAVEINDDGIPKSGTLLNQQFLTMQLAHIDPNTDFYLESFFGLEEDSQALKNP